MRNIYLYPENLSAFKNINSILFLFGSHFTIWIRRVSQRPYNHFVTCGTIQQLFKLFLMFWTWQTTLVCKVLKSFHILRMLNRHICRYSLGHGLGINGFRRTWSCLIKFLATLAKFLEPSGYCTGIKYAFTFSTINVYGCFRDVMAQFKLIKNKFSKLPMLHVHLFDFQIAHGVKKCTKCQQRTNYHNTMNKSGYLEWLRSRGICAH